MEDNPTVSNVCAVKVNVSQSLDNSPKKRKQWSTSRLASGRNLFKGGEDELLLPKSSSIVEQAKQVLQMTSNNAYEAYGGDQTSLSG
jgi:hypothetical protein